MKKRYCALVSLVILLVGLLAGCGTGRTPVGPGKSQAAEAQPTAGPRLPVAVGVYEVKLNRTAGELLIPAVTSSENLAVVLAQREGMITQLTGEEGTRVTKGRELARLNDDDLRTQLHQAELEASRVVVEERQYEAQVRVSRSE